MPEATVYIVDDDAAERSDLAFLVESAGLKSETFGNAQDFLSRYQAERPGCLLLDMNLPRMSGLELQERLTQRGATLPVIVMTGRGSTSTVVQAMKAGAMDVVDKPANNEHLLNLVQQAIDTDARQRTENRKRIETISALRSLSKRERQVLKLVADGLANKVIAAELNISTKTVESHRARVMEKMRASSLAELVRKCFDCERWREAAASCWG